MAIDGMDYDKTHRDGYAKPFSHDKEFAELGSYSVDLDFVIADLERPITRTHSIHVYRSI